MGKAFWCGALENRIRTQREIQVLTDRLKELQDRENQEAVGEIKRRQRELNVLLE